MKKVIQSYKSTLILIGSILIGTVVGLVFKEKANVLKPFGDIFLNLLLVSIVPLIFLTITTSLTKMKQIDRFKKIVIRIFMVFAFTSIIAAFIGIIFTKTIPFVKQGDVELLLSGEEAVVEELNLLQRTANLITTTDFVLLFSKENIVALLVFSVLIGISIRMAKEDGKALSNVLVSANKVIYQFVKLIMYYAPIGLGCYFASLVGTFGSEIAKGYLNTFLLYTAVSLFTYFVVYSFYAYLSAGKKGFKAFWKHIIPSTFTALATCSSAASIPVNIEASKKIGVKEEIAEMAIPLGTTFHKDGSIIGSVFKIMFIVYLFGLDVSIYQVILVSLVATLLVTAVPIGGGTISEALILSFIGAPMTVLPMLTIIATIIDPPATMLNVVGDTTVSMLTSRLVDGKEWMKEA